MYLFDVMNTRNSSVWTEFDLQVQLTVPADLIIPEMISVAAFCSFSSRL